MTWQYGKRCMTGQYMLTVVQMSILFKTPEKWGVLMEVQV